MLSSSSGLISYRGGVLFWKTCAYWFV
jgi:hypothetical protein